MMSKYREDRREIFRSVLGKSIDSLPVTTRQQLAGLWIATEIYSTERLPLRIVQAIAPSPQECISQLKGQHLDPSLFEYELVPEPFAS